MNVRGKTPARLPTDMSLARHDHRVILHFVSPTRCIARVVVARRWTEDDESWRLLMLYDVCRTLITSTPPPSKTRIPP